MIIMTQSAMVVVELVWVYLGSGAVVKWKRVEGLNSSTILLIINVVEG
jgi:hypothetical protein